MPWYQYLLVVLAGFAAGFINTLAGSGSAVSMALLDVLGVPTGIANGTNRVAILLQNAVAVRGFSNQKKLDWSGGWRLAVPSAVGAVVGAVLASRLEAQNLRFAIGIVMLVVLAMLFVKPKRWLEGRDKGAAKPPAGFHYLTFFAIGVYGGFIQVGVGVFLLVALVLSGGYDLVRGNAVKVLIILAFTVPALAVFVAQGHVRWRLGLVLAVGNMLGAWVATRQAAKRGAVFVRWLLVVVVSVAALRYLGVFGWIHAMVVPAA